MGSSAAMTGDEALDELAGQDSDVDTGTLKMIVLEEMMQAEAESA